VGDGCGRGRAAIGDLVGEVCAASAALLPALAAGAGLLDAPVRA
jgi:hypothetical protein